MIIPSHCPRCPKRLVNNQKDHAHCSGCPFKFSVSWTDDTDTKQVRIVVKDWIIYFYKGGIENTTVYTRMGKEALFIQKNYEEMVYKDDNEIIQWLTTLLTFK